MTWLPLWTSAAGVQTYFKANGDGTYTVWSTQDNDPLLEHNAQLRGLDDRGYTSPSKDFRREGSVPLALIEKWKQEEGVNVLLPEGHDFLRKKLNDSDWANLRTSEGKT